MTRKATVVMAVVALLFAAGCKKKQPDTSADMEIRPSTVEPAPQEVTSDPEVPIGADETESPLDRDLQEADAYAQKENEPPHRREFL